MDYYFILIKYNYFSITTRKKLLTVFLLWLLPRSFYDM